MWIMSISLLFLSGSQAFLKSILILCLSKPEYPILQTGLPDFDNRICPTSKPDSRGIPRTCSAPRSDISGLSAISDPLARFQRLLPDMSAPQTYPASPPFPELTKYIWLLGRIPEVFPGHGRPPTQTCLAF
jgi:hypothetical protein